MGTTSAQKKLFFNLRKAKAKLGALEEGDLRPENVARIAHDLNVTEQEELNRRRRAVRLLDLQEWGWANPLSPAEVAEREGLEPVVEEDWVVQREVNVRRRAGQAKPEG